MGATKKCAGGSTKKPEGLVGVVVLAGIDMDVKLGLALFEGNKGSKHCGDQNREKATIKGRVPSAECNDKVLIDSSIKK